MHPHHNRDRDPGGTQVKLADHQMNVIEPAVLKLIMPVPALSIHARAAGLKPDQHFIDEAHAILFSAAIVGHEHGIGVVYDLAERALRRADHWLDSGPSRMGKWTRDRLRALVLAEVGLRDIDPNTGQIQYPLTPDDQERAAQAVMPWMLTPEAVTLAARRLVEFDTRRRALAPQKGAA